MSEENEQFTVIGGNPGDNMFDKDLQLQRFIESLGFLRLPPIPPNANPLVVQPKYHHVVYSPVVVEIKVEPLGRV